MSERREDFELLQKFVRQGEQAAFAEILRRHVDLVYGTAYRRLEETGAAEEVTQNVFAALARKAWRFAPDDSLPAWLHRTALLEAKAWLRGELRRRRREQTAAELGTTMKTPDEQPALAALTPLLDEALLALREADRTAVLLRFYEGRPLRSIGASLGVGEDAAQKRVAGAVKQLSAFFQRRGFRTVTPAIAAAALQHTAKAAPAALAPALAHTIAHTFPTALGGLIPMLSRFTALTRLETVSLCAILAAAPVAWQWNDYHAARQANAALLAQLETHRGEHDSASAEIERLRSESASLDTSLADAANAQAANEQSARAVDALKARIQGMLTDPNYRWPDGLPYFRVPKSVVRKLDLMVKFAGNGTISERALELYAIDSAERASAEKALGDYWRGTIELMESTAYETNMSSTDDSHPDRVTKTVAIPPLGTDLKTLADSTRARLTDVLGQEREQLLFGGWEQGAIQFYWPGNLWKIAEHPQTFTVWADPKATQQPYFGASWSSPDGGTSSQGPMSLGVIPSGIERRFFQPWLQGLGITN